MTKKIVLILFFSLVFMGVLFLSINVNLTAVLPQSMRAHSIGKNLESISSRLKLGLTKAEVAQIVGQPQNRDAENVWMWIEDYKNYVKTGQDLQWRRMLESPKDGLFVVFIDDRLATGIYANSAATPVGALKKDRRVTIQEAESMIANPK